MLVMLGLLIDTSTMDQESVFPDIPENHWAYDVLEVPTSGPSLVSMEKNGIIHFTFFRSGPK